MLTRKKYKACSPEQTVSTVQSILAQLNIETEIEFFSNTGQDYSCRLRISNKGLKEFDIGVNGKGMSKIYALASAYGELMERLQNKALFRENVIYATKNFKENANLHDFTKHQINSYLTFQYFPDESNNVIPISQLFDSIIPTFFPTHASNIDKELLRKENKIACIFAPFVNLKTKKCVDIPVEWFRAMCSSTGLCAGNTKEEALVQGINEICERYVLMKLFLKEYVLPTIPLETFKGHDIYDRIANLKKDYKVIIKDCSLDLGFPVIGLLLIKQNEGSYSFRLGADFNIITALERCYTESSQGENALEYIFNEFNIDEPSMLSQYQKALKNGTGTFPHCVLYDNKSESKFPHIDFSTYEEELNYYILLFSKLNTSIYAKDNSFLGFPAYSIYIPGFSTVDYPLFNIAETIEKKNKEHFCVSPLLDIAKAIKLMPQKIIDVLPKTTYIELQKWNTSKTSRVASAVIGMYAYIALGNYKEAHQLLKHYIDYLHTKNLRVSTTLRCTYDILVSIDKNKSFEVLRLIYGNDMIDNVVKQINDVPQFFQKQKFPHCFLCDKCETKDSCHYHDIILFEHSLQSIQKKYKGYIKP